MENQDLNNKKNVWPLIGNNRVTSFLEKNVINEKLASSYIFLGPNNLGKAMTASFFAKSLLCQKSEVGKFTVSCAVCASCNQIKEERDEETGEMYSKSIHGDFHLLSKEEDKKNISVEQIREFIKSLSMSSFSGSYKIGIINDADNLSIGAANALLKTLEEPREKVIIILILTALDSIPATVASRSSVINFYPVKSDIIYDYLVKEKGCAGDLARNISHLCLGRPRLALRFFEDNDFYEKQVREAEIFLDFFEININQRLMSLGGILERGLSAQASVKRILNIIRIWQGVLRDLMLVSSDNYKLLQYEVFSERLKQISSNIKKDDLLKMNDIFEQSCKYLKSNVNPRLVLENIACNII